MNILGQCSLWWAERPRREQVMLAIMSGMILLAALYYGLLRPSELTRDQATAHRQASLIRGKQLTRKIEQARIDHARQPASLRQALEQASRKAGVYPQIGSGEGGYVALELQRADPARAMQWLEAIDQQGISLSSLRVVIQADGALQITASVRDASGRRRPAGA